MFFHFSNFGLQNLQKKMEQILADLFLITRRDHLINVASFLKCMEPNGRGNDFENSQFLSFLQNIAFGNSKRIS